MKLHEAMNETAKSNGWNDWNHIRFSETLSQESKDILFQMAATLYAKSKWEEAIEEMRAISELDSDVEIPEFEP
jgi:hypothetical protein